MSKDRAEEFNVDDVVIGHSFKINTEREGLRGVIFEPLQYLNARFDDGSIHKDYFYRVKWCDGSISWCRPRNLRKPPEEFDAATLQEAADLIARLTRVHAFEKVGKA